ncbi:hypothetical protein [Paenibacillus tarimensis]|uniref:hypothetical protein n=1 Tax=Paenibacillus tarimensis TaxID=416012 RepID=UPI001F1F182F|nr:hypothetical protein [Paenibacillus tarimensis]MCF2942824.1 hypothetical protein [Paenibacillus tarimensis]
MKKLTILKYMRYLFNALFVLFVMLTFSSTASALYLFLMILTLSISQLILTAELYQYNQEDYEKKYPPGTRLLTGFAGVFALVVSIYLATTL